MTKLDIVKQKIKTLQESFDALSDSAVAYTEGKDKLATEITGKGVETSPNDSLATMADNVRNIQQESYTIQGSEVYEKQMFGGVLDNTTPYQQPGSPLWNLYAIMTDLLSDGRFINYGGILLAEYFKGYDTIELMNVGASGAYFTCDGDFYTTDKTGSNAHVWHDSDNGKMNRWVAYLFAVPSTNYTIPSTELCPRSIHIGRKVGTITCSVAGRISEIVVLDGNELLGINFSNVSIPLQQKVIINNISTADGYLIPNSNSNCVFYSSSIKTAPSTLHILGGTTPNLTCISFPELLSVDYSDRVFFTAYNISASNCVEFYAPKLTSFGASGFLYDNGAKIKKLYFPELVYCTRWIFWGYDKIESLEFPKWTNTNTQLFYQSNTQNLINIECGETVENIHLNEWNPTNVIADSEKLATLNSNIRNHIAAKVSDRTGLSPLTFTVSTNLYNNLEPETIAAFTAKNWNVAGA